MRAMNAFGQVGSQGTRFAYQVLGSSAPAAVRFLAPDDLAGYSVAGDGDIAGLFSAVGVVGLMDLGVGVGTLAMSAETLATVRRIESKVDVLWYQLEVQNERLARVERQLGRIDSNVAEQNLRSALGYALPRTADADRYNFLALEPLAGDIDKFTDSLDEFGFGLAPNLRLSSDVRRMLEGVWHLVYGAQLTRIAEHNRAVGGDPEKIRRHPFDDHALQCFAHLPPAVIDRVHLLRTLDGAADELGQHVFDSFMFAGDDARARFSGWLNERVASPLASLMEATSSLAQAMAEELLPVLVEFESGEDIESAKAWILEYLAAWVLSDAGLVFRLLFALKLQADSDFWDALAISAETLVVVQLPSKL